MITCPNCGHLQEEGAKCAACGSSFSEYSAAARAGKNEPAGSALQAAARKRRSALGWTWWAAKWSTLAASILTIALIFHRPARVPVTRSAAAATRAEEKLERSEEAARTGQASTAALDATELNSYLGESLALEDDSQPAGSPTRTPTEGGAAPPQVPPVQPAGTDPNTVEEARSNVKDFQIELEGDVLRAEAVLDVHGLSLTLTLAGHLNTENGYLRFEPVSGSLGSFPLPQKALRSAVETMLASPENREKLRLPADIADVRVANGELLITYR